MTDIAHSKKEAAAIPQRISLRMRITHLDSSLLLFGAVGLVLIMLVVNPLGRLIMTGFTAQDGGAWTLANYIGAYTSGRHLAALGTSLLLGVGASLLCLIFAVPIAWGISRTDMPGKALLRALVIGAFVTPSYLGAIGWMLLAGPNAGWLNRAFIAVTGAQQGPFNIFSFAGVVFIVAIYSFPYIFVFTTASLDLVSSEFEDAAAILGAGILRTTFRVTLPLVLPAILGGVIVTFLEAIALFGAPTMIGVPAHVYVVTTELWQMFFEVPSQVGQAAAYAMPLLLITVLLFVWQQRIVARKGFVSLTGKGGERRIMPLGPWRWVLFGYAMFVVSLPVVLPYLALAQAAFAKAWGRGFSFANLTLDNFRFILFDFPSGPHSIANSMLYSAAAATCAIGLALLVAYIALRRLIPFAWGLSFLCLAPFVIPGMVQAIGFYAAYTTPPIQLYDTAWILILAFTTRFLPIAYASSEAAVRSLNPEMEDAVRILGGSRMTALRRVVAPLLKNGLIGAWLLVFIPATKELAAAIFLYGPKTETMSILLFNMAGDGNFEQMAAFGMLLLATTIVFVLVGYRLVGRDFMLRRN